MHANVTGGTVFKRNQKLVSRRIDDETLIVPIRGGVGDLDSIFAVNAVGSQIWDLLAEEVSLDEIVKRISSEYDIALEQLRGDVQSFLTDLSSIGLLVEVSHPAQG